MGGIHIFEKPCYREIRAMRNSCYERNCGFHKYIVKIYKIILKKQCYERIHLLMRGVHIFEKPCYREIRYERTCYERTPCIYIRTYSMGWLRILFFAPDYIFLCENWFSKRLAMVHDFPPWLTYSNEIDIQLSWKYPSVRTIMKNIVFPYTRWIMTKKIIRLVSCF